MSDSEQADEARDQAGRFGPRTRLVALSAAFLLATAFTAPVVAVVVPVVGGATYCLRRLPAGETRVGVGVLATLVVWLLLFSSVYLPVSIEPPPPTPAALRLRALVGRVGAPTAPAGVPAKSGFAFPEYRWIGTFPADGRVSVRWPVLVIQQLLILIYGGVLLTWMLRRRRFTATS